MNSHKEYATDCISSMHRRSDSHDYRSRRFYLITMAVSPRWPLLGTLASSEDTCIADDTVEAHIELSPLGEAVLSAWQQIPFVYPQVSIVQHVIMPDHIHGILYVREDTTFHLGQVIKGFKTGCNKSLRLLVEEARKAQLQSQNNADGAISPSASAAVPSASAAVPGVSAAVPSVSAAVPSVSAAVPSVSAAAPSVSAAAPGVVVSPFQRLLLSWAATLSQHTRKEHTRKEQTRKEHTRKQQTKGGQPATGLHLWEKGYNDKILFNYSTLDKWKAYLSDNPRRLAIRRLHPDYFRVRFGITVAGRQYAAIGNRMLLRHPEIIQVQLSRHFTDDELAVRVEALLRQARHGAVLISPAISKGEQMVMRRAMDENLPLIFITPWGFNTFSKPGHQYYEACAAGRFLMLAPWEHHNHRIPLTREMCLQLNAMAAEIAAAHKP